MKLLLACVLALVSAACVLLPLPTQMSATCTIERESPFATDVEQSVIDAINDARPRPLLTVDINMQYAAVMLAESQADNDAWSITDKYGQHVTDRLVACGISDAPYRYQNSILVYGAGGPDIGPTIVQAMLDPANAGSVGDWLDPHYTNIGVGAAQNPTSGTWYYSIVLISQTLPTGTVVLQGQNRSPAASDGPAIHIDP